MMGQFQSKVSGAGFTTLDGSQKTKYSTYSKQIKLVNDLSKEELVYILKRYVDYNKKLETLQMIVNQLKL